jgi:hypothetical protein
VVQDVTHELDAVGSVQPEVAALIVDVGVEEVKVVQCDRYATEMDAHVSPFLTEYHLPQ